MLGLALSAIWILSTIILIVSAFDLLITFANIIVFSLLLLTVATAPSINLLTWLCFSSSKFIEFSNLTSATDDKICNEKFESRLFTAINEILSTMIPIVSTSDFVIILANIIEFSWLLPPAAIALSINLLTWICFSLSKVIEFSNLASVIEDKTCKETFEFSLLASDRVIKLTIFSDVVESDLEIISPIKFRLILSSLGFSNIWLYIFSLITLFTSNSEVVINRLLLFARSVITPKTNSLFVSKILSIDCPILISSELFKTSDKNSVFSPVELSTIKSNFSCLSIFIFSLIISTSNKSILPSLLASKRFPFKSFSSSFFWIKFSSIELASTKSSEALIISFFSSSVLGLSEIPVSKFTDITCSGLNNVFSLPPDEILIVPTFPKLSSAKLTSEVPSILLLILNLVPLISNFIWGSSITIEPLSFFAILPDSIITDPLSTLPKKMSLRPFILNSITLNEEDFLIITVELSLYWTVVEDISSVRISSCNKISSYRSNNRFSPSILMA